MTIDRREFLRRIAAGSAIVTMPAWLQGCGVQGSLLESAPPSNPFLDWFGIDEAQVGTLMSTLTAGGADIADIYFQHARSSRLTLEDGVVGNAGSDLQLGAGMRVVNGDEVGFAFTEDLSADALLGVATQTGKGGAPTPDLSFTTRSPGDLYTVETSWSAVGLESRTAILERIDALVRAADPSISRVALAWDDTDERILIATLDGELVGDVRPMTRITLVVTATRDGATQSGFASIAARAGIDWYSEDHLIHLVDTAVTRTLVQFDARRVSVGELPVILAAGESGVILHEAIGHALEGDFVADGTSPYAARVGAQIASEQVSLVDDAAMPHERGALNVDDEGTAAGRTQLVEEGKLRAFLHDQRSALAAGATTTGSGRRESYRHRPLPRMSCTQLENGPHSREEIIESVDKAIICETYPGGRVDLGAGDFRFDVKNGWLVENGRVTAPVKDFAILGNGPDLLGKITMVGNDGRMDPGGWTCGKKGQNVPVSQGMPTVLVDSLIVEKG